MRIIACAALIASAVAAPAPGRDRTLAVDHVRCELDAGPPRDCRLTDTVGRDGTHRMVFTFDTRRVVFVGRSQTGWWAGTLNGRPAMGYERNRGNMVLSTQDLKTSFAWWYPGMAHGTY